MFSGTESNWGKLTASVPRGLILGPFLFHVCINDLTDNISCNMKLFADVDESTQSKMKRDYFCLGSPVENDN